MLRKDDDDEEEEMMDEDGEGKNVEGAGRIRWWRRRRRSFIN